MPNTRKRHLEIYDAAVKVLENAGGVETIDALPQADRPPILRQLAKRVTKQTACHIDSAKRNIAKALRRARYGIMQDRWGGIRPGAGRPPKLN